MKRLLLLLITVLTLLPNASFAKSAPTTAAQPQDKVERAVLDKIKAKGRTGFWIMLNMQADLSAALSNP